MIQGSSRGVLAAPRPEVFVFVHGYNVTFEGAAQRTAQIAYDLKFSGAPIFYSWPSQARTLEYTVDDQPLYDRLTVETWYNNTRFHGNAQNPAKRQQFPVLDYLYYDGYTDVAALSAGYTAATTWGVEGDPQLTVGTDLRFTSQYLDEIADGLLGFLVIQDANSPPFGLELQDESGRAKFGIIGMGHDQEHMLPGRGW